ncbi:ribosome-associated translation inhibitor RaiA [Opitutus sp. ER46]|uniref:ribosome hibernation-promoting factor, HPF/YfiA family n=1 Tax=Opitutus sp. ER46 TaxID=2161864 RepID=UPI001304F8BE|nr:ribosome-associated translation inhibitor RaiA [Opitutus sp. ER46]
MNNPTSSSTAGVPSSSGDIIVRGVHLEITPALRAAAEKKAARLLVHHQRILRIRLDLEFRPAKDLAERFVATGRIEISGPDLIAHVASDEMYKSIDLLVAKLDRMLIERTRSRVNQRNDRPEGTEFHDKLGTPE